MENGATQWHKITFAEGEEVLQKPWQVTKDASRIHQESGMKYFRGNEGIIYSRKEAAFLLGCSTITLCRAYWAGFLKGNKIGTNIRHTGRQLLDWLEDRGRTHRAA
jgi:hypothetical protein